MSCSSVCSGSLARLTFRTTASTSGSVGFSPGPAGRVSSVRPWGSISASAYDTRFPNSVSITGALLLEAAFAGNHREFQDVVAPLTLLFFPAALGSRAASIRLARPLP